MELKVTHDLHKRRYSRNLGVALTLVALISLIFGLTVVKVTRGDPMQAFDHAVRPELAAREVSE